MKTSFVLTGGGVLGAYQVGMIKQLLAGDIIPDSVHGNSVGSVNAAAFSMFGIAELEYIWRGITFTDIFGPTLSLMGFFDNDGIATLVSRRAGKSCIPHIDFTVAYLDLFNGVTVHASYKKGVIYNTEDIVNAVQASSAIPMICKPVEINGMLYCDAGITNNAPIDEAVRAGADRVFVLFCSPKDPGPNGWEISTTLFQKHEIGLRNVSLAIDANISANIERVKLTRPDIEVWGLWPQASDYGMLDFSRSAIDSMIKEGEAIEPIRI